MGRATRGFLLVSADAKSYVKPLCQQCHDFYIRFYIQPPEPIALKATAKTDPLPNGNFRGKIAKKTLFLQLFFAMRLDATNAIELCDRVALKIPTRKDFSPLSHLSHYELLPAAS